MDQLLFLLWGKTNERDKGYKESDWKSHPAICHMIDVGYVAERWLQLAPHILDCFCQLAPGVEREILRRIIVTLVALHDLGKFHREFQSKSKKGWEFGYGSVGGTRLSNEGRGFDHGLCMAQILADLIYNGDDSWDIYMPAIVAVASHHGRYYKEDEAEREIDLTSRERPVIAHALVLLQEIFGMPEDQPVNVAELSTAAFTMYLAGFASVADWIGSQSEIFTFTVVGSDDDLRRYLADLRSSGRADTFLADAGLLPSFSDVRHNYLSLFDFSSPHPLQSVSELIPFGEEPGPELALVEGPMGMGKTELALYLHARALACRTSWGMYFGLPTQASANALFDRIMNYAVIMTGPDSRTSITLAHGARMFFDPFIELMEHARDRSGGKKDEKNVPSEIIAPSWMTNSSKRMLLAAIGLGSIDQAMLGAIGVKHAFVRLFALAGKVVVLDEIHAYDAYMNEIIVLLLKWLRVLGCKVILLSATLPRTLRQRLLAAYGSGPLDDVGDPAADMYPQILHLCNGLVRQYDLRDLAKHPTSRKIETGDSRTACEMETTTVCIQTHSIDTADRTREGAEVACDALARGGCIAWIRNTVREAQEGYRGACAMLKDRDILDVRVIILHARYTRLDRNRIEDELIEILGKKGGGKRPLKLIVVATQVIEQSVDIDFDEMISDLAPIDLVLQRLGRLWRHPHSMEVRFGRTEPLIHLLLPDREELRMLEFGSSAYVYDAETLSRSASIIVGEEGTDGFRHWTLPTACRTLVSHLYDRGEDYWTAAMLNADPNRLTDMRDRHRRDIAGQRTKARVVMIPDPDKGYPEMEFALRDEECEGNVALSTRYGAAGATVVLVRERGGKLLLAEGDDNMYNAVHLPEPDATAKRLMLERAVALSAVSFPWYEKISETRNDERLAMLDAWWRERHPHDNKIFLLLNPDGTFSHPRFTGQYGNGHDPGEGLVIAPVDGSRRDDRPKFEDL